jgi:voltage-gated potassium channel
MDLFNSYLKKENSDKIRNDLNSLIFQSDSTHGKKFEIVLLILIFMSFFIVLLESVKEIEQDYHHILKFFEWVITILFTIEYIFRIISVKKPMSYIFSFFGIIDLISILPTYLSIIMNGPQYFIAIRLLRLLRVFRILKLIKYVKEAEVLYSALRASSYKIFVFLTFIVSFTAINGTLMFIIEGEKNGFVNIPVSMYWAIVTLTTVGYGDIVPHTFLGKIIASIIMLSGYAVLAVPTGIVTSEIAYLRGRSITNHVCPSCVKEGHDEDAVFCKFCGDNLHPIKK